MPNWMRGGLRSVYDRQRFIAPSNGPLAPPIRVEAPIIYTYQVPDQTFSQHSFGLASVRKAASAILFTQNGP